MMEPVPAVFADANALYPAALRDILIELAIVEAIRLHWSPQVLDELDRSILKIRPDTDRSRLASRRAAMNAVLPAASVDPSATSIALFNLPDPKDSPIAAAAHDARCSILLTFNLKHFPEIDLAAVEPPIVPMHPDVLLVRLMTQDAAAVLPVIENVRRSLRKPPISLDDYAASLTRSQLPQSAELIRHLLAG